MENTDSATGYDHLSDELIFDEVDLHIQENLEDDLVKEALKTGVDLRKYSETVENELKEVENASIQDYIKESKNIASLHQQVMSCDGILQRMEEMLQSFQTDLGSISNEILSLQNQSITMSIRLKNRQAIRGQLSQFVDDMVVSETMIYIILNKSVTDVEFMEQLKVLDNKIHFVKEQVFQDAKSCLDVKTVLENLKMKAICKIREFLLQKISQFKKPMTNYQIPQNTMIKYHFFYKFLMAHAAPIAQEICDEYAETMSKVYYSYFSAYVKRLMKLQFDEVADKDDLLATEDTAKKSLFGTKPALKNRNTIFTLGNRGNILTTEIEAPVIVPHAAKKVETKYPFESLFRSFQYALVDNSCHEFTFVTEFFMARDTNALLLFEIVMGKTMTMLVKHVDDYVQNCYDAIAVFLCIHLIYRYQLRMHKEAIPALDRYWDALLETLWPRFEFIMHLNIHSLQECDPQRLGTVDMRPHYITRRCAEFSAAIIGMNETFPNERVNRLLALLQLEIENCLLRMAAEFQGRREQLIFLINNYDIILGVLVERTKEESKESENFKKLLASRIEEYVDEVLSPHFGGMIVFVKDNEMFQAKGQTSDVLTRDAEKKVQMLVKSFNSSWKKAVEDINSDIMRSFTNFKNGTNILQATLGQLIQYYHRFQKCLSLNPYKNLQVRNELINIHTLMVEVKKYKPAF